MDDPRDLGTLTDEKAAQLLDRAAKLDAQGRSRVTIQELRQVAMEAGISEQAFDYALSELEGTSVGGDAAETLADAPEKSVRPHPSLLTTIRQRTGLFITGSALSLFSMTFISDVGADSEPVMIFTLAIAAFIVAWSAVTKRRDREILDFEVDLGVLWTAMTFWTMVLMPNDMGAVLEVMMPAGFLASLVGGFFVATGPSDPQPDQLPERV